MALFRNRPAQGVEFMGVSIHDFEDWRAQQTSFEDIAAYFAETVNVGGTEGEPIRYLGAYASARMFEILRVQPVLGRVFRPEEDHPSTPPVMLLSYRAWQDRFQGDPAIVGRDVRANAEMTTIVGVMPEQFGFPQQMDAWLPLRIDPLAFPRGGGPAVEGTQLQAVARLKAGVTVEAAQAEMATIAAGLATTYPASNQGIGVTRDAADRHLHRPAGRRHALHDARRRVRRAADCLRQRRQPAAGAHRRPQQGGGDSHRARRQPRPHRAAAARRDVGARARRRGRSASLVAKVGIDFFNARAGHPGHAAVALATMDPAVIAFVVGLTGLSTLLAGTHPGAARHPRPTSPRS